MYAVEFETQIQNGVVNIPKKYSHIYQSKAKFLVLIDEVEEKVDREKDYFTFFENLRNRHIIISSDVDIDPLMNEMNDGLC